MSLRRRIISPKGRQHARRRCRSFHLEPLEARCLLDGSPIISEFLAVNDSILQDEDGDFSDWIELHNPSAAEVNLGGWYLTDDPDRTNKWRLPDLSLPPHGYTIVFASDKDRRDPSQPLHTNFKLSGEGEYVALVRPDGMTVAHEISFPEQISDISYGALATINESTLVSPGDAARAWVPHDDSLGYEWTKPTFDDSSWPSGTTGVGYDRRGDFTAEIGLDVAAEMDGVNASAYIRVPLQVDDPADLLLDQLTLSMKYDDGFVAFLNGQPVASRNAPGGGDSPSSGLGAFYSFDETLADRAEDYTANGGTTANNLTAVDGGPQYVPGVVGKAVALNTSDGDADRLTAPLDADLDLGGQFTVEGWIYPTELSGWSRLVMEWDGSGKNSLYFALRNGSQLSMFHVDEEGVQSNVDSPAGTVRLGSELGWQHVAVVGDGEHLRLYHNGKEVSAGSSGEEDVPTGTPYSGTTSPLAAGLGLGNAAASARPSDAYHGYLDEVALWSVALTPEQIASHYEAQEAGYGLVPLDGSRDLKWNSTALAERPEEDDGIEFESFDISDYRELLQLGDNLLAVQGLNVTADNEDFLILPELHAGSFELDADEVGYFAEPTPAAANNVNFLGLLSDTRFSVDRGYFTAPFELQLGTESPGVTLRYTLDGSPPTETTGFVYEAPIEISTTTTVRAAAFRPGYRPSDVVTNTYIFLDDVLVQSNEAPRGAHWDTEVDPQVVNDQTQTHSVRDGLVSLPTLSIVMPDDDLFGSQGIYQNPEQRGDRWVRPGSVEFFYPDEYQGRRVEEGFAVTCGIRISGIFSRLTSNPKHSFRLSFQDEFGPSKLDFPLFADSPYTSFDNLVVLNGHNQSWATGISNALYLRDQVSRDLQELQPGDPHVNGIFVNLYLNGLYWGQYNLVERPDDAFAAAHFGGDKDGYDVFKGVRYGETPRAALVKGTRDAWDAMFDIAKRNMADPANYAAIQQYVDIDQLIDYNIGIIYTGDRDGPTGIVAGQSTPKNFYALRQRTPDGRFRFFPWDAEFTFEEIGTDVSDRSGSENPGYLHFRLRANPEYRLRFADRVQRWFFNEGRLTPEKVAEQFLLRAAEIDRSIVSESARWGDAKRSRPYTRDVEWVRELDRVVNRIIPRRSEVVLGQFRSDRLFPDVPAPQFAVNGDAQHGGVISIGDLISISASEGTVYYTLDGSDPRVGESANPPSDDVSPAAMEFVVPFTVDRSTQVKARVLHEGTWSALSEVSFTIPITGLQVSELMYHPQDGPAADGFEEDDFEFVELANVGQAAVPLSNLQFIDGISFDFAQSPVDTLAPGQRIVVVANQLAFQSRYGHGIPIAGEYTGQLDNAGERIVLRDRWGEVLRDFQYQDDWYPHTDGDGYSLTIVSPSSVDVGPSQPSDWRPSLLPGGSPGTADTDLQPGSVVINEVLRISDDGQGGWVELHNTTWQSIDIGHWYLSNSADNLQRFRIAAGTQIPPRGYLVLTEADHFGPLSTDPGRSSPFALGNHSSQLFLSSGDDQGRLLGYRATQVILPVPTETAQGRYLTSSGIVEFAPLIVPTPAAANALPQIGPLVINEVMYNPHFVGREFIELHNVSNQDISLDDGHGNGWRIQDAIDYEFPAGHAIPAGGWAVLMQGRDAMDPADEAAAFRLQYAIPNNVEIFVYTDAEHGSLSNGGETLRLERPVRIVPGGLVDYTIVDTLRYDDTTPWPHVADGDGPSLSRFDSLRFGNEVSNWLAGVAEGTPGHENRFFIPLQRGDFSGDGQIDAKDIDLLNRMVRSGRQDPAFDLTSDGQVTTDDRDEFVLRTLDSVYGDANLDGLFDTRDLVQILQRGHYEDGLVTNSGWADGDWDGDGEFATADLVLALQYGAYETQR